MFRRVATLCSLGAIFVAGPASVGGQPMVLDPDFSPKVERGYSDAREMRYFSAPDRQLIVVGGWEWGLTHVNNTAVAHNTARLLADGSLGSNFSIALNSNESIGDLIALADGRFFVATRSNTSSEPGRVHRLLANGDPDPTFPPLTWSGLSAGLTVLSDSSLIVWGNFTAIGGVSRNSLAHVLPNGAVDPSFSPAIADSALTVLSLAVTRDHRVVFSAQAIKPDNSYGFYLQRLTTTGAVDPTFAPTPPADTCLVFGCLSDHRVIISENGLLRRLQPNGTIDSSYTPSVASTEKARHAVVLPDDRLAVEIGTPTAASHEIPSVRILARDGALQLDCRDLPGGERIQDLRAVLSDGTIAIVQGPLIRVPDILWKPGIPLIPGMYEPKLCLVDPVARTLTSLPTTFESNDSGNVSRLTLSPDGGIIAEGSFTRIAGVHRPGLAKFKADGSLDPTFNPVEVSPLLHLADGRIIGNRATLGPADAEGFHSYVTDVVRLKTDGTLDASFAPPADDVGLRSAAWLAEASDGRMLVCLFEGGVAAENQARLAWVAPDGSRSATLSTTFAGFLSPPPIDSGTPFAPSAVQSAAVLPDGKLLLRTWAATVNGDPRTVLIRLNADGSTDSTYVPDTRLLESVADSPIPLSDGRAYLFGDRVNADGTVTHVALRLNADGSPDAFVPEAIAAGLSLSDGSFIYLADRYHADGTRDLNFNLQLNWVYGLAAVIAQDGSLWIGRSLGNVMGQHRDGLARLIPAPVEGFTVQPEDAKIFFDADATFVAELGLPDPATFQWTHNGGPIPGATGRVLHVANATRADAGEYRLVATVGSDTYTSDAATLTLELDPQRARLTALSGRSRVPSSTEGPPQIGGFIVRGDTPRSVLLRAIGMGLSSMMPAEQLLAKPVLRLFHDDIPVAENTGGIFEPDLAEAARRVGAFPVPTASNPNDINYGSALLRALAPGIYTAHTFGQNGGAGISLFEVYDAETDSATPFASGISLRGQAGAGDNVLIVGFIIKGKGLAEVVIRGSGPDLTHLGVHDALADPQITLFNEAGVSAANDNWQDQPDLPELIDATARAQLTPFADGSRDAALHVRLPAGIYTVHGGGVNSTTGEMLLEIYTSEP